MRVKEQLLNLRRSLVQLVGNKRYFNSIEKIFKKMESLDLTSEEIQALRLLACDINQAKHEKNRQKNRFFL